MIGVLFFLLLMLGGGVAQAQVASPMLAPPTVVNAMSVPNGGPPQIVGYSAANVPESDTVIGDVTFARTAASQYTATVHSVNGVTAGNVATLNVGTGLTVGAGSMLNLTIPVPISSGGTGTTTAPTADQILIAQTATACGGSPCYLPMPVGGDVTIAANGVVTVHEIGGVVPGGTCGPNQFVNHVSASGVPTCTTPAITGIPAGGPPQIIGYSAANIAESETVGGGPGGCSFTRTGANAYEMNCTTYAPLASPSFTGDVNMPGTLGQNHWNDMGVFATAGTFGGAVTASSFAAPQITVNSGTGYFSAAAGAVYRQPGWDGVSANATWSQTGLQNIQAIGIGQPVGFESLGITVNQNTATLAQITNSDTGPSAIAAFRATNGTNNVQLAIAGAGNAQFAGWGQLSAGQGLQYNTQNGLPHTFSVNGQVVGGFYQNGLHLTNPLEVGSGGTATATAPTQNQILIAQGSTTYAPQTVSGDLTLASTGVATVGTSGSYQPYLYVATNGDCGLTYAGRGGYYYKVGKLVTVYFTIQLSGFGSCANAPLYVSLPYQPTVNGGVSMDLIQAVPFLPSAQIPTGSLLIAQGTGASMGTGVVGLGALINGNVLQMTLGNLAPNSTVRGRAVFLTD